MTHRSNSSTLQSEIDRNLKRAYDDVLNEDVPDRFMQLLTQLRQTGEKDEPAENAEGHSADG
jgi:hypothetical protein